ncbi:response regulator [filamentous cyanobacterium LEGE 11480]|uniref:histidine kinase n=1 Tax=Romeriopsis navalis LEGE 11480 TaxID=2777977 RepID=A0A928VKP7_9CYAN|nr:response regulator [Romeriopsis navalis]MBE9028376.1 response regulator [Romeriopsis navalis LEGE 11480]
MPTASPMNNRVLIVDDNPTNLEVLFACLDAEGWEVVVAQSGASALQKVEHAPPNLILLDVMMPEMDGFETCLRLKRQVHTCDIPVIFLTALADTANKVKGLKLGAVDYITKPFERREIIVRVRHHLRLHQLNQSLIESNQRLAQEVCDRQASEADLAKTLQNLKQLQHQLIQTEKLSSLGTMVAGIAHEFNNPINFIQGNLKYLAKDMHEITEILSLYQQEYPEPSPALKSRVSQTDLPFILSDLPKMLRSMSTGTERLQAIVASLGTFANLNHSEYRTYHLHEALDSTLLLLENRLQKSHPPIIKVTKRYGDIPRLSCYPSQLNQVCLNILTNAIESIEASKTNANSDNNAELATIADPEITVETFQTGNNITIRISDNGPGIPAAIQPQIFDPFFTTKPVGINKGMGLTMSHQIITERHNGQLEVESSPESGTSITILLPIHAPQPPLHSTAIATTTA